MLMNPPTLPSDYVAAVHEEELVRALKLIRHATAPTPNDGGHHEAAHDLADAVLKRVEARRNYENNVVMVPARVRVGIEVQCAQHLRVRWQFRRFSAGPQSGSHLVHVSASPPTIPDGGISPVRF